MPKKSPPKTPAADPAEKLSISLRRSLALAAERKAASQQRTLSNYIASLIARDAAKGVPA